MTHSEDNKTRDALLKEVEMLKQHERALHERVRHLEAQNAVQLQADQEIIRLERQRALEDMAQGVAHNFNNVLVGVLGYAQIIEIQSKEKQTVTHAKKIVENALRAKELVQKLNRSVREAGDLPLRRITTLDTIILEAIKTTQAHRDEAVARNRPVTIVESLQSVPPIKGNPIELSHVLTHLITNAIDAMPRGGNLVITTREENNQVAISLKDEGIGMSSETRKRIFEPFFTTKQDVGSGLGLSMAHRTVTSWGGRIQVDSAPNKGSTFTVFLPVWTETNIEEVATEPAYKARILVVDDEEAVHEVIEAALGKFDLTLCMNGEQALAAFETKKFDLALIDLQLPGISGEDLVRRFHKNDPELTSVLMTGWDVMQGDPRLDLFAFHLPKPFRISEMTDIVERALSSRKEKSNPQ